MISGTELAPIPAGLPPTRVRRTRDRLRGLHLPVLPVVFLGLLVVAALVGPYLTPHDPFAQELTNRLAPPSWTHPLGTDGLGRDVLSRLLAGARTTLEVASVGLILGGGIGLALGLVAGYRLGWIDSIVMRVGDAMLAIPTIFFGLLFAVSMGPGFAPVVLAISIGLWSQFVRIIRAEVLSLKERDFVTQARVNGSSSFRILSLHLFPNVVNVFVVLASLHIGGVILAEASLSFLGAGIPPPAPSWGQMAAEGQRYLTSAWWLSIPPGAAITLTVVCVFMLGDWIRDYVDPRQRQAAQ
jgi:peptide/nickel transport system permease protein